MVAVSVPGSEILTSGLNMIAQSLQIPVIIFLVIFAFFAIVTLGSLIAEYTSRKKVSPDALEKMIYEVSNAKSSDELMNIIKNARIYDTQKVILVKILRSESLTAETRETLARKLVEFEETNSAKRIERTDIVTRIGPTLGLMGTLIPMGPGLAALGAGDVNTLANAIIVAFSNSGFEVFNSIGIFSILGFMTLSSGIPFNELVTEGTGLAFVVFPQVFNIMGPAAYVLAPLFFLCILFAGITSVIALLEGVCYSISEKFLIERKKTATVVCIVGFLISSIFATGIGSTLLGVFDGFLNNFALLFAVLLECIIFGWIYKFDDLIETLNNNSSIKVGKTWKTVIKYILPICILGLWIQGIYSTAKTADGLSTTVMIILTIVLIVVPIIFTKLPAINKDYYNVEN